MLLRRLNVACVFVGPESTIASLVYLHASKHVNFLHHLPLLSLSSIITTSQLLSEMEVKAGFKQKKDVRATKTTPSVLAPTAIAQDALRDAVLDAVATEVFSQLPSRALVFVFARALPPNPSLI